MRLERTHLTEIPVLGDRFFDCGRFFIYKTALGGPWGDGSQQAGADTAMDSFWRCNFFKDMAVFVGRNISAMTYLQ